MKENEPKMEARKLDLPEVCTQPQCMLRDRGFDGEFAADLMIRLLAGEDVAQLVPEERHIVGFERCRRCARSVMRNGRTIATPDELRELVSEAHRSRRRRRRSQRNR